MSVGRRVAILSSLFLVLIAGVALAQPPAPPTPDTPRPAPEVHRDYMAELHAAFTPENQRYSNIKTALRFASPFYGVLACLIVLFAGWSARMRDVAVGLAKKRYLQVLIYLTLFAVVMFLLSFPLALIDDFLVEHAFNLSNQSFGAWMGDQGKALLATIAFLGVVPILWLAYLILEKAPRRWWLWLGLVSLPLIAAVMLLSPIVFEPIFNKFEPLQDKALEARILDLAAKADIPSRKVFQVNKSAQTKTYNAYVSGFGASQRIVLWDTTLQGLEPDEILYVMGHEMGHYVLGHIWKGIVITSAISMAVFFAAGWLSGGLLRRYGRRWGFEHLHDVASMPLLLVTVNLVSFTIQMPIYAYTRGIENEADVYGLEITRDNDAAARAFLKLGAQNKSNPEPSRFVELWLYSHPPDGRRLRLALEYKPWEQGRPNKYFKPKP